MQIRKVRLFYLKITVKVEHLDNKIVVITEFVSDRHKTIY